MTQQHKASDVIADKPLHDERSSRLRGRLLIFAASLMWSTSGLFAKATVFDEFPTDARGPIQAFWRALFAGLLLIPLVRRPRFRLALVPMTLCFAVMNVLFLSAITYTTAANAIWLQNTAPVWVLIVGSMLLGETILRRHLLLLAFGAAGVAVILGGEVFLGQERSLVPGRELTGVVLALGGGLTYAAVMLFLRTLRCEDAGWLIVLNLLVTAMLVGPYVAYLSAVDGIRASWPQLGVLAAFGLLQLGIPYVLFARGLRHISSQEASGIVLLEPILMPILVLLAWGEHPSWWTYVGGALILTGLVIRYAWPSGGKATQE